MFTGIVTVMGRVVAVEAAGDRVRLRIEAPWDDLDDGESVAVNGACLTVVDRIDGVFAVDAVVTTRRRTRLADLRAGDRVNLERALAVGDRLGGHFVQGHVDGLGDVVAVREDQDALLIDVRVPVDVADLVVPHGSIAVEGVSMTVNAMPAPGVVQLSVVPHTRSHTTLGTMRAGDRVHVEGDLLGKFVKQLLHQDR